MNIYTQVCGMIIVAMLLFFYHRQPTMGLSSEKRFCITLYIILACVVLDIVSCYFIAKSNRYGVTLVSAVCKLYLISLQAVAFSALHYAISDIFENFGSKQEKFLYLCFKGICIVGIALTIYLPIYYYYDGHSLYSFGPAAFCTYIFAGLYIVATMASSLIFKRYLKPAKTNAILFWMTLWAMAAIIQLLHPRLLIVSFASAIGALIMYFEMENPQSSISRRTGHFSSAVIREYFEHMYQNNKKFSVLMISFRTVTDSSSDNKLLRKTIEMLSEFLFTIDTAKVFDTAEGYFLLVFNNNDFVESTKFKITTYIQSVESNPDIANAITLMRPYYTIIPDCSICDNADELMLLLTSFIPNDHNTAVGNEVVVNLDIIAEVRRRKQVEKMVIEAMEQDRIEVHYQPIYNIATQTFTSAEALVRIRLNNDKLVLPTEFIPIVEQTGRIVPLSNTIYKKTLSFMKSYHIERLGVENIELNLSVRQGESPAFTSKILEQLEEFQISPEMINLEITETSSLHSKEVLYQNMKRLEEYGLTFSLDDFGSGSSNLNYIIDMPVNIVKLDNHLSEEYLENPKAKAIVNAVIEMAHSMGIKIIAEGIETKDAFEAMKALGVDYIQGFYFSKPLPEHEFLKFMQSHNL